MKTFITPLKYKIRVQWNLALWYLGIYILSMLLVYWALMQTNVIGEQGGSFIYRIWGSVIFLFAISIRFREDFNFLLTMSYTRLDIFLAQLGTALAFSALFSGFILLERVLVDYANSMQGYQHITDPIHYFAPFANGNLLFQFIYFLGLSFCLSAAGLLIGALSYRFGKKFTLPFWMIFSGLPFLILPAIAWWMHQQGVLAENMEALGSHLTSFNVPGASAWLLTLGLLFSGAVWLTMRRLSQR